MLYYFCELFNVKKIAYYVTRRQNRTDVKNTNLKEVITWVTVIGTEQKQHIEEL